MNPVQFSGYHTLTVNTSAPEKKQALIEKVPELLERITELKGVTLLVNNDFIRNQDKQLVLKAIKNKDEVILNIRRSGDDTKNEEGFIFKTTKYYGSGLDHSLGIYIKNNFPEGKYLVQPIKNSKAVEGKKLYYTNYVAQRYKREHKLLPQQKVWGFIGRLFSF